MMKNILCHDLLPQGSLNIEKPLQHIDMVTFENQVLLRLFTYFGRITVCSEILQLQNFTKWNTIFFSKRKSNQKQPPPLPRLNVGVVSVWMLRWKEWCFPWVFGKRSTGIRWVLENLEKVSMLSKSLLKGHCSALQAVSEYKALWNYSMEHCGIMTALEILISQLHWRFKLNILCVEEYERSLIQNNSLHYFLHQWRPDLPFKRPKEKLIQQNQTSDDCSQ